jgi:hypothetical protein
VFTVRAVDVDTLEAGTQYAEPMAIDTPATGKTIALIQ